MKNFKNSLSFLIGILILFLEILSVKAQETEDLLKVGDKAPPLEIQEWLQGDSVNEFKPGQFYLIEFTGVFCPPCRTAAPHLTELANVYKGRITVIGIHIWENSKRRPEDMSYLTKVENYLEDMGEKIGFTIAVDVPKQITADTWMRAAGISSIPMTFLVDGNTKEIVWIGHPMDVDPVLKQVLEGKSK